MEYVVNGAEGSSAHLRMNLRFNCECGACVTVPSMRLKTVDSRCISRTV